MTVVAAGKSVRHRSLLRAFVAAFWLCMGALVYGPRVEASQPAARASATFVQRVARLVGAPRGVTFRIASGALRDEQNMLRVRVSSMRRAPQRGLALCVGTSDAAPQDYARLEFGALLSPKLVQRRLNRLILGDAHPTPGNLRPGSAEFRRWEVELARGSEGVSPRRGLSADPSGVVLASSERNVFFTPEQILAIELDAAHKHVVHLVDGEVLPLGPIALSRVTATVSADWLRLNRGVWVVRDQAWEVTDDGKLSHPASKRAFAIARATGARVRRTIEGKHVKTLEGVCEQPLGFYVKGSPHSAARVRQSVDVADVQRLEVGPGGGVKLYRRDAVDVPLSARVSSLERAMTHEEIARHFLSLTRSVAVTVQSVRHYRQHGAFLFVSLEDGRELKVAHFRKSEILRRLRSLGLSEQVPEREG